MYLINVEKKMVEVLREEETKISSPLAAAVLRCYELMSYGLIDDDGECEVGNVALD
jgi:hypothetical protein